ncbi:MAG: hypothetical protein Q4C58_15035 [Eubacteriales bacterium]|nr:hypothetical protein [Eubacteriales bacterium]
MKPLKNYSNLYQLYLRSIKKFKIPFFICLLLFILAFATFVFDHFPFGLTLAMMGMIFPAILFGLLWLIASIRTKKHLKRFSSQQLKVIDDEIPSRSMYEGLVVTSPAIVGTKVGLELVPLANVLWVYTNVTTGRLDGLIPIYKDTTLMIADRDHKQYGFRIKNNQKAFSFIQSELLKHRLDIVFGYERGMDDIYKKDINRLIAFSQECAEKRQKEMGDQI